MYSENENTLGINGVIKKKTTKKIIKKIKKKCQAEKSAKEMPEE